MARPLLLLASIFWPPLGASYPLVQRTVQACYASETAARNCYSLANGGTPQRLPVADIRAAATYLRDYGRRTPGQPNFLSMSASEGSDCAEWSLYSTGAVLVLAKHIDPSKSTSVLFEDIATTIDGGENATAADAAKALLGCGRDGGSLGVVVNATNPSYHDEDYEVLGYSSDGIIIKLVHAP